MSRWRPFIRARIFCRECRQRHGSLGVGVMIVIIIVLIMMQFGLIGRYDSSITRIEAHNENERQNSGAFNELKEIFKSAKSFLFDESWNPYSDNVQNSPSMERFLDMNDGSEANLDAAKLNKIEQAIQRHQYVPRRNSGSTQIQALRVGLPGFQVRKRRGRKNGTLLNGTDSNFVLFGNNVSVQLPVLPQQYPANSANNPPLIPLNPLTSQNGPELSKIKPPSTSHIINKTTYNGGIDAFENPSDTTLSTEPDTTDTDSPDDSTTAATAAPSMEDFQPDQTERSAASHFESAHPLQSVPMQPPTYHVHAAAPPLEEANRIHSAHEQQTSNQLHVAPAVQAAPPQLAPSRVNAAPLPQAANPVHAAAANQAVPVKPAAPQHPANPVHAAPPGHAANPIHAAPAVQAAAPQHPANPVHAAPQRHAANPIHAAPAGQAVLPQHPANPVHAALPGNAANPAHAAVAGQVAPPQHPVNPIHAVPPGQADNPIHAAPAGQAVLPQHPANLVHVAPPGHVANPVHAAVAGQAAPVKPVAPLQQPANPVHAAPQGHAANPEHAPPALQAAPVKSVANPKQAHPPQPVVAPKKVPEMNSFKRRLAAEEHLHLV